MMKKIKLLSVPILLFAMVLFTTTPSFGALGKVAGVVTDAASGEALPGVNVQIEGTSFGAATNLQGQYTIINLPPGTYNVVFTYMGYATKKVTGVRSQIDATTTVNGQLSQTVIEGETITVVAQQPIVDKTMTATKVTFSDEVIDNQLPVSDLNQILSSSVVTQNMRGANKVGVGYMIDGVNVADPYASTGAGSQGYSMVKREMTANSSTSGRFEDNSVLNATGRDVTMVQTLVDVAQSAVQEVNVVAGTINAEYAASGGVINIASKSGSSDLSAKVYVRSSLGGLDHAGPDVYDAKPDADVMSGMSAAEVFLAKKAALLAGNDAQKATAQFMTWEPGAYEYGEDPRINAEVYLGGPLTSKGNFFFSGNMLNDHGRFPGEFNRNIDGSLKINYNITKSDKLTLMGKLQDGGKLGGWYNRFYTYTNQFFLEGQPVSQTLGYLSYLKHSHVFDSNTFLESTISLVGNNRTYGYSPKDDKLVYGEYGEDFLILDTPEKCELYLNGPNNIFIHDAGNNQTFVTEGLASNQGRFGKAGYSYEDYKTSAMTFASNFTKQVNFNHQIKAGGEYTYNTIDVMTHNVSAGWMPAPYRFIINEYEVNPWSLGTFIQDRIEYEGIIVNLGLRFDGYSMDTKSVRNLYKPGVWDTTAYGMVYVAQDLGEDNDAHFYFSPRLGISHPISETSTMHYSWGIYTTQPNKAYWLQDYGALANLSLPRIWDSDPEPEKSTAYEIGVTTALTSEIGADLTAFYRDNRNSTVMSIEVSGFSGQPGGFTRMSYYTNLGYRDSRGLELTLWKRPSPNRYFGIVGVSGTLSASFSYDSPASLGTSLVADKNVKTSLIAGSTDELFDLDLRFLYPTISRSYSDWNGKLTMMFDFPAEFRLSTITTYRSPWRFAKTIGLTNSRYEERLDGDYFLQTDVRLSKYFSLGKYRAGFFVEALNALDRLNILSYETYVSNVMYEKEGIPWGPLNRPVNNNGIPYAGIARELYAGFEFSF